MQTTFASHESISLQDPHRLVYDILVSFAQYLAALARGCLNEERNDNGLTSRLLALRTLYDRNITMAILGNVKGVCPECYSGVIL